MNIGQNLKTMLLRNTAHTNVPAIEGAVVAEADVIAMSQRMQKQRPALVAILKHDGERLRKEHVVNDAPEANDMGIQSWNNPPHA